MSDKPVIPERDPYFSGDEPNQNFKPKPEDLEYERLCYKAFLQDEDGQALLEQFKKRFHCMPLYTPMHPNADKLALFFEGYREALRGLEYSAKVHQQRIQTQQS